MLAIHLVTSIAKLLGPGGARGLVAETLLVKHQLLIINRSRRRAPNLTGCDRIGMGLCSLFMKPDRIRKAAATVSPVTLFKFHEALKKRKYRVLFSGQRMGKPGPKGPSRARINAIVEMKCRNPRYGCRRIAQQPAKAFGVEIDKDVVRRVLEKYYRPGPGGGGPATRRIIGSGVHAGVVDGIALCRMFNRAIARMSVPKYLSTDNDPLFTYHRWLVNLRILEIDEVKTVPYTPISHPFVESLVGSVRRELLDQVFFWNTVDLERKLRSFQLYFNNARIHASLDGKTPVEISGDVVTHPATLCNYTWEKHCGDLYELPVAA